MNNNKFKYVFEDDYNFYYTNNIVYKCCEYAEADPRMIDYEKV